MTQEIAGPIASQAEAEVPTLDTSSNTNTAEADELRSAAGVELPDGRENRASETQAPSGPPSDLSNDQLRDIGILGPVFPRGPDHNTLSDIVPLLGTDGLKPALPPGDNTLTGISLQVLGMADPRPVSPPGDKTSK